MEINITKEERFIFTSKFKKILGILLVVGILAVVGGIIIEAAGGEGHHAEEGHAATEVNEKFRTGEGSGDAAPVHAPGTGDPLAHDEAADNAHGPDWVTRLFANLWINNLFFTGLAVIGVFFIAIQYVSQAGWSTGFLRIPLAMGAWLPFAGVIMLVVFLLGSHDLFHWTHESLYEEFLTDGSENPEYDAIIAGKKAYLNIPFFIGRMVAYFVIWAGAFYFLRKKALEEDIHGGTSYWYTLRKYSAIFLVLFAVTSSTAAWDWAMSIDPHWFSTLFGWYLFSSWWVAGLAAITLVVVLLKEQGYLKVVNANHIHDLGKFVFAFSIFWTYLWFSQFMLIYYANIPEEAIYFIERMSSDYYAPIFFINLFINFVFPFFMLMTRDAKRHAIFLKITCVVILLGHWIDFYLMVTPGVMKEYGGIGLLEIGLTLIYGACFLFVTFTALAKAPLVAKNHPMLEESLHHHI